MSAKTGQRLSATEDRPRVAAGQSLMDHNSGKVVANDRRSSAQETEVRESRRLSQTGTQSPTKRTSDRRLSSNGDVVKRSTDNSADQKSIQLRLDSGTEESTNGVTAHSSDPNKSHKAGARKGFLRGVVTTEQHDKQKSLLNTVRATRARSDSGHQLTAGPESIRTVTKTPDRARKSFVIPLPPTSSAAEKTNISGAQIDGHLSHDDSSSQSTPGTPSKRRKRHYKGGTYGLYLSKKRKNAAKKKAKESELSGVVNAEGEESSQSFRTANSESDEGLDAEYSDEDEDQELEATDEREINSAPGAHRQLYMNDVGEDGLASKPIETSVPVSKAEEVTKNGFQIERQKSVEETPKMATPTVGTGNISGGSSIINSVKNRPRRMSRRTEGTEGEGCLSPPSSTHSKSTASKDESKLETSPTKAVIPKTDGQNELSSSKSVNSNTSGAPVRPVFQLPANTVNSNVIQNPNRRTLLRISTAGSVASGDTHGTYLGGDQSKFVIVDKTIGQLSNCMCSAKPLIDSSQKDVSKGKPLFCQAIDCFDEKLIGCCNQVRLTSLFRSSKRVPYRILCEVHLARLRRHHCCPGCGLFCTQGEFNECFCVKKQIHLFHKKCQVERPPDPKQQRCLHCGSISQARQVRLEMNGTLTNNTYYLQQTSILKTPKARIAMTKRKGKKPNAVLFPEEYAEPGIEYTIPATKKILSLAGLPFGPQRKQLEELLVTLYADNQSIRLTIQQNKNFYAVARSGEVDKVLSILAQGFDPNFPFEDNDNETPLHAAASGGHLLVVHLLIQSGANPNVLNKHMTTPLMQAIEQKHNLCVKYLISSGASLDIRGEDGMTSLHIAAKCGNIESVHYIVDSGLMNVNLQDEGGWSALVWATEHKYYNIVKLLVSKGADPNIEDDEENVGLHWAAFSGETNIAFMFLEMGSNVVNQTNIHGDTPLHIAARRDNYECVVLLLSRGADITLMNKNNESPLQCAPADSESEMALKVNAELKRYGVGRQLQSEKLLHKDLSKGKEHHQIQVVNGVDNEPYPIDFMYVTDNCEASQINIDRTITSLQSCQCEDDCTSQKCVCAAISFRCWYDKEGKLLPEFNLMDAPMIFECNRACSCWKTCNNRVVQNGVLSRLQVFRTNGKGWGVRALRDIPKGTFVCEYVGEIISDSEADRREDDSYLFDLDNKDGETYCLDARFYGNICRFINHLCQPNLTPVKVFVDHQDLSFPRIALFSSRDIKAYEELGFDYGEKFWVIKYKTFTCSCGSVQCKYNKDSIHQTIEYYYKRLRDEQIGILSPTPTPEPLPSTH